DREVRGCREVLGGALREVESNADDEMLKDILARNGLQFDAILTSEACRSYKPAARIFEAAIRELGVPANAILHVGDSLEADIGGAQRLGMATAWVNRSGEPSKADSPRPNLTVR